jgi:hypothetical protein
MRKSLVSIVALGLFLGAPALAGSTAQKSTEATSTQQQSTQQQSTQQQQSAAQPAQMGQLLSGYEERSDINGHLAWAMGAEGDPMLILVAPEDLAAGGAVAAQENDIRDRFEGAGFSGLRVLDGASIARAELDDEHYIFALTSEQFKQAGMQTGALGGDTGTTGQAGTDMGTGSGTTMGQTNSGTGTDMGTQSGTQSGTTMGQTDTQTETQSDTQSGTQLGQTDSGTGTDIGTETDTQLGQTDTQTGTDMGTDMGTGSGTAVGESETGQASRALSEPDAARFVSDLEEAGLQDAQEFQGRLAKAMDEEGTPIFFIITSKDMESTATVDVSEDEVRQKLEQANLQDVEFIDDAKIVRGTLEGDQVFVVAGDLMGRGTQQ